MAGVSNLLASLGHNGRSAVLGHTLNTETVTKTDEQKKGLCIIFVISTITDKQKSPHTITLCAVALSKIF